MILKLIMNIEMKQNTEVTVMDSFVEEYGKRVVPQLNYEQQHFRQTANNILKQLKLRQVQLNSTIKNHEQIISELKVFGQNMMKEAQSNTDPLIDFPHQSQPRIQKVVKWFKNLNALKDSNEKILKKKIAQLQLKLKAYQGQQNLQEVQTYKSANQSLIKLNKSLDNKIVLVTQTSRDYISQVKTIFQNKIGQLEAELEKKTGKVQKSQKDTQTMGTFYSQEVQKMINDLKKQNNQCKEQVFRARQELERFKFEKNHLVKQENMSKQSFNQSIRQLNYQISTTTMKLKETQFKLSEQLKLNQNKQMICEKLKQENRILINEKYQFQNEINILMKQKNLMNQRKIQLQKEKMNILQQKDMSSSERKKLIQEKQILQAQKDNLILLVQEKQKKLKMSLNEMGSEKKIIKETHEQRIKELEEQNCEQLSIIEEQQQKLKELVHQRVEVQLLSSKMSALEKSNGLLRLQIVKDKQKSQQIQKSMHQKLQKMSNNVAKSRASQEMEQKHMEFNEALSKSKLSRSRLSIEERINKNGLNTFNLSGKRTQRNIPGTEKSGLKLDSRIRKAESSNLQFINSPVERVKVKSVLFK